MRSLTWLPLMAIVSLVPATATAVTVEQVVALAHAGVTDAVILALIDRDKTILAIEPEQLITLKRDGISDAVILAMLKSGREEGDQAARADAAYNFATIAAAIAPAPETISVGHGPDRPNTAHPDGFYSGPPAFFPSYAPSQRRFDRAPQLCIAQVVTGPSRDSPALRFVTECPVVMQPRRLR